MGQYYKAVLLKDREVKGVESIKDVVCPHAYSNGAKLMEHSYIGNHFVSELERKLTKEEARVVWAGDYADEEPGNLKYTWEDTDGKKHEEVGAKIYDLDPTEYEYGTKKGRSLGKQHRYIVNESKKEFVDKNKCPDIPDWSGTQIHPLPLLTVEGNGRGGGDYRREHPLVGTWARDRIKIVTRRPSEYEYTELVPNFQE